MLAISYINGESTSSLRLLDEKDRPTPTLVGLAAAEIAFDVAVGYAAYRVFRLVKGK